MKTLLVLLLLSALAGCHSGYRSYTQADDSKAYIQLNGDYLGAVLIIDDNSPVKLDDGSITTFELDDEEVVKFEVSTGSHQIKIMRNDIVLVNRRIYISAGNTFEVVVK